MLKKLGYISLASLVATEQALAIDFGANRVSGDIQGTGQTLDVAAQTLVRNVMIFLAILSVLYGIYGGFLILTAAGEEDKVKKGKTILIQVAIGLVVIFLANSIVQFVVRQLFGQNT